MVAARYEDAERKGRATVARPDGSEVDLYYQSHQDEFTTPEKVRVAVLFVQVPRKAGSEEQAKARQRAEELRIQAVAASGELPHFGLLAQTHSDDQTTRYRGGDCGWITRENLKQRWDAQVVAAIVKLQKPGQISPVVRAADGYYLAKLIQRKAALTAPLKTVRERIEKKLMDAAQKRERERFEQDQRAGLKIEINEALLKSIEAPARSSRGGEVAPPPMPFQ
jgi:parvulin-like peptidyl-prolyl isomerase